MEPGSMAVTAAQVRAARGLIAWSQTKLALAAGVGKSTVADFERGVREPIKNNLLAMERALEEAGVSFTNGDEPGVKLRKQP
ncbi:helix-turn-helix domain-containing protein [Methylobacterium sp. SyP6R]|nr:helix-turn-helix transcriptional regulator [Methylobacterium sp. SyP6R]MCF4130268.1 helix-turn-helix domain-containing protein [Methylobacterium sp. SyP6R]